jgi:hypothetical protein
MSRKERHRQEAATAALGVLALGAEFAQRLRELDDFGDDLPPAITEGAPRLAEQVDAALKRMTLAAKSGAGRIR